MTLTSQQQITRLKMLYELSMTLSGDPMDIFVKVARMIGEMMDISIVCLSEIRGCELYFLSIYRGGEVQVNAGTCPLEITPCATVEASRDLRIYDNVMARFPKAAFLQQHNAFSYCGFPSLDHSGKVVAVTCLLDDRPRSFSIDDQEFLRIIGQRIGLEIERLHLEEEHREAIAELARSEQRFRDLAKESGDFVWEADSSGHLIYLSDHARVTLGYQDGDLPGLSAATLIFPEDFPALLGQFRQYAGLLCHGVEHRIHSKAGQVFWVSTTAQRLLDAEGQTSGYWGVSRNITPRMQAHERLEEERNLLRHALDGLFVYVALLDPDGKAVEVNRAPLEAAGIKREDYIGLPFGDTLAWRYDTAVRTRVKEAVRRAQQGETVRYDERLLMGKGIVTIDFSIAPLFDAGGRVTQIIASGVDISERKIAESALRQSEARLELAMLGAEIGLWDWDIQTGAVTFSQRWESVLGYAQEELKPCYEAWEALIHPDDLPGVHDALNALLNGRKTFLEIEYRALAKDKTWRWLLGRGKVIDRDADGVPLRAIGIDMDDTARKNLEARLRQSREELFYAQRLTAAGEMTAMVAHELNQPLGAINNYIGGIFTRFKGLLLANPSLAEALAEMQRLSERASSVVHGIRGLVRREVGCREWVSLAAAAGEVISPFQAEFTQKGIHILLDITPDLPRLWCERIHLQQLLLNLVLNAVQAMDDPGITVRKLLLRASINARSALEIVVSDTGSGIPSGMAMQLFEPFYTSKKDGIGLGLSVCRTIVEFYGGKISAGDGPGLGAAFEVVLPLKMEENQQ